MQSCTTTIYRNSVNQNNFSAVQVGKKYTFYENGKPKYKARVSAVEENKIVGVSGNHEVTIAKDNVRAIKKSNPGGTTAIVVGSVAGMTAFVALLVSLVNNSSPEYYYY